MFEQKKNVDLYEIYASDFITFESKGQTVEWVWKLWKIISKVPGNQNSSNFN